MGQINTVCGNVKANFTKVHQWIGKSKDQGIDLIVFPELSLVGYPPKDFLFDPSWIDSYLEQFEKLVSATKDIHVVLGCVFWQSNKLFQGAVWIDRQGQVRYQKKILLPNTDVFDEKRYFETFTQQEVWLMDDLRVGVSVCEDLWAPLLNYEVDPIENLCEQNPQLLINISASPFFSGKHKLRQKLVQKHVDRHKVALMYVNAIGGNDELVFDGASFVMSNEGEIVLQAKAFEEDFSIWNSNTPALSIYPENELEQKQHAILLGLKDFVHKSGFDSVVIGLSGGIDSALIALLAVEALGVSNVHLVFMPSQYTSSMSHEDAKEISVKLGIPLQIISIDPVKDQIFLDLNSCMGSTQSLTQENIQARLRGTLLMAIAQEKKSLVIQTGNKSEIALGYCTLYGDMVGAISPIGDLYKYEVYTMAQNLNQKYKAIPKRVFEREPSAELKDNQHDTDSLPPYDVVDPIVKAVIEDSMTVTQIVEKGFSLEAVKKITSLIENSEFKRKQAPPIIKLTPKAFGSGRRMPIAKRFYENP